MAKLPLAVSMAVIALLTGCASTRPTNESMMAATPAPTAVNISGSWAFSLETPTGKRDTKLIVTQTGESLSGVIESPQGGLPIAGTVKGSAVAFSMKMTAQGMNMTVDYKGLVEGNVMTGMATFGNFGEGNFTAKKE